jgi:hypothetical protein
MIFKWDFWGEMCFIFETRKSHPLLFFAKIWENIFFKKNYAHKKNRVLKVARP